MILVRRPETPDRPTDAHLLRRFGNPDEMFLQSRPKHGLLTPAEVRSVALAEMALAGNIGLEIGIAGETTESIPFFFGEDQARYILAVPAEHTQDILDEARDHGIFVTALGKTHAAKTLRITGEGEISLSQLRNGYESWFPNYMAAEEVQPIN